MKIMIILAAIALAQAAGDPHLPPATEEVAAPTLPEGIARGVLIVSKTNGWRHIEHIPHSNEVIGAIAAQLGRASFTTENAAVFNDTQLGRFAVVVLNSASGEFLTPAQEAAFARFVARGGGVVALHAAGDDSHRTPWYARTIIGTRFIGHPGGADQIQPARVTIRDPRHPVMQGIARDWMPRDEWYSFSASPARQGMRVLAAIDEASYRPGATLAMGAEHPIVWINPAAKGRVIYSAIGHLPESYDDPVNRRLIANAIRWAAR